MHKTILVGEMSVTFLKTRHETGGVFDLFELTIPPFARQTLPHFHREYDETIFGVDGTMTWVLRDEPTVVQRGSTVYIPRNTPHFYVNRTHCPARILCLQTPGVLGPEYYVEMAALLGSEENPDVARITSVMGRYGIIPIAQDEHIPNVLSPRFPENLPTGIEQ
jgi:quercetin dioxygenase-like cupin family protein